MKMNEEQLARALLLGHNAFGDPMFNGHTYTMPEVKVEL